MRRMSRFSEAAVVVVMAVLLVAGVSPSLLRTGAPAGASTTPPALGVVTDLTWGISRPEMDRTIEALRSAGVGWVRMNMSWAGVEPTAKGQYNTGYLSDLDYAVQQARAAGLRILMPVADGVPYWASADPNKHNGSWSHYWQPTDMADYADFVRFVVGRYGPMGVDHFEIWNEPNHPTFWPSGVDPKAYVPMLKAGYAAVKQVRPGAQVLLGGLSKNDADYLEGLYRAGAGGLFDIANVHPYAGIVSPTVCWTDSSGRKAKDAFCGIEAVRDVMVANGDGAKDLWLTELGWSTTTSDYGVTEAQQAQYLTEAFAWLADRPYVTHAFWYSFRNTFWTKDDPKSWDGNAGVLRTDFSAKPALAAMTEVGAAQSEPTTTTTAPTTTTTAPATTTTTTTTTTAPPKPKPGNGGGRKSVKVQSTTLACPTDVVVRDVFSDVPVADTHALSIDCMASWSVTNGSSAGTFQPVATVSRGQMASMVARAIERSGKALPASPPDAFGDDDGSVHELRVNQLAALGIVQGTGQGRYAPDAPVSRAAMATYVVRTYAALAGHPLPESSDWFTDTAGLVHESAIDAAAEAGIAAGGGTGTFDPHGQVRRGQVATFLARTLDLLIQEGAISPTVAGVVLGR